MQNLIMVIEEQKEKLVAEAFGHGYSTFKCESDRLVHTHTHTRINVIH